MIYSLKCTEDTIFKIIFHLSISKNNSFYYFEFFFFKSLVHLIDIIPLFFEIKDRKTILFSSDLYYSNFCIVCFFFFFFPTTKIFKIYIDYGTMCVFIFLCGTVINSSESLIYHIC